MIVIPLELSDAQAERLQDLAEQFQMPVCDFLREHFLDRLENDGIELARIADRAFEKNDELLRRLA